MSYNTIGYFFILLKTSKHRYFWSKTYIPKCHKFGKVLWGGVILFHVAFVLTCFRLTFRIWHGMKYRDACWRFRRNSICVFTNRSLMNLVGTEVCRQSYCHIKCLKLKKQSVEKIYKVRVKTDKMLPKFVKFKQLTSHCITSTKISQYRTEEGFYHLCYLLVISFNKDTNSHYYIVYRKRNIPIWEALFVQTL